VLSFGTVCIVFPAWLKVQFFFSYKVHKFETVHCFSSKIGKRMSSILYYNILKLQADPSTGFEIVAFLLGSHFLWRRLYINLFIE